MHLDVPYLWRGHSSPGNTIMTNEAGQNAWQAAGYSMAGNEYAGGCCKLAC